MKNGMKSSILSHLPIVLPLMFLQRTLVDNSSNQFVRCGHGEISQEVMTRLVRRED